MSHARLEENTDKLLPSHFRLLSLSALTPCICASSIYLPNDLAPRTPPRPRFRTPDTRQRIHQPLQIAAPIPR
jgi:hypothetical protein